VDGRGLFCLKAGRFEAGPPDPWLAGAAIRALYCDQENGLWIGSYGQGLACLQAGRWRHWSAREGLPSVFLHALTEDAEGNLWISSDNGIFGCPRRRLTVDETSQSSPVLWWHLSVAEGLETKVCSGNGATAVAQAEGRLYFPNQQTVAVFAPQQVRQNLRAHPVTLDEVWIDGVLVPVAAGGKLRVKSGARHCEFHFTSPDLKTPGRLRFRYCLQGLDTGWVESQQRRVAHYYRLPPGDYHFRVMVGGADGQWHEAPEPLELSVLPRLWERPGLRWAAALVLLALVIVTVRAVERSRARRRLERIEARQRMEQERQRIARDLHDDLGAGLTEVVLLGEWAGQDSGPVDQLKAQIANIVGKTRQLVTAMDEVVWTVNPRHDSAASLASYLADFAGDFFRPLAMRCRVDIMDNLPATPLPAATRHHLFLTAKEALHNAAKHSAATEVWLRVRCDDQALTLSVEDNGKGFDADAAGHQRHGLKNMRQRIAAIGGTLTIQSAPGAGTKMRFSVPLGRL
jgi:signal transduction histidine kinase